MKFNGTIFSKPQQDQLKENIGNELEKVSAKVDEVDARMLNYKGDWVTGDEYHENDLVTWTDGQLYEVIKAHTSSTSIKPDNTEYYKAMTAGGVTYTVEVKRSDLENFFLSIDRKSIVDIEMSAGGVIVHPILMSRSTSFIAFYESVKDDQGSAGITFSIIIAHIVSSTSAIAKKFNFGIDGSITTEVVNVPPYFTVTFIK